LLRTFIGIHPAHHAVLPSHRRGSRELVPTCHGAPSRGTRPSQAMRLGRDRSCAAEAGEVESHRIDRRGGAAGGRCTAKRRQVRRLSASPVGVCSTVDSGNCSPSRSARSERTPSIAICQWPAWRPQRGAERLPRPRVAISLGVSPAGRTAPAPASAVAPPAHSAASTFH
jgi:hypothetical protein